MAAEGHEFGSNGFDPFEDTNTHTAGGPTYPNIEGWGPLVVYETCRFSSSCVVVKGRKPSTAKDYPAGSVIYSKFTRVALTTAGLVHGQRIEKLTDF